MTNLPVYLLSGFSQAARKRKLHESAVRTATQDAAKGLNTRIPFIKSLIGKAVFDGPSYNMKRFPAPIVEPGLSIPCGKWMKKAERRKAVRDVVQFNIENADKGVQAVTGRGGYLVENGSVKYYGDLKVTTLRNSQTMGGQIDGTYDIFIHEAFIQTSAANFEGVLDHELEHALHYSLFHLAGYPMTWLDTVTAEYLAYARGLFGGMGYGLMVAGENLTPLTISHVCASRKFIYVLMTKYGLTADEFDRTLALFKSAEPPSGGLSDEAQSSIELIARAALAEYDATYRRLFGLDTSDIKDVLDSLPYV
jgi:hypothetical protein